MMVRGPRSLLGQIGLVHLVTIVIAALVLPIAMSLVLRATASEYQRELLEQQADMLQPRLSIDANGWHARLGPRLGSLYDVGSEGRAFLLVDGNNQVRLASAHADLASIGAIPMAGFFSRGSIRGLIVSVATDSRARLIVLQDINDPGVVIDDVVRVFLARFLWVLLPLLALLPIANVALIRRSTQTIRSLSLRAAEIGPATLDIRLPAEQTPAEVAPLAIATNRVLDQLELAFRKQSEFIANVAHELRTPLATLHLKTDAMRDVALAASMRRTLDQATHVIAQLLDLASLEQLSIATAEHFDLVETVRLAIEEIAPSVYARGHSIGLVGADRPLLARGRAPLIALVLTNLIDNAVRHTPPGTRIEVRLGDPAIVIVSDDGPGFGSIVPRDLTTRFRRDSDVEGSGIGLSIVERILAAHGAALDIRNAPEGGAVFQFGLKSYIP